MPKSSGWVNLSNHFKIHLDVSKMGFRIKEMCFRFRRICGNFGVSNLGFEKMSGKSGKKINLRLFSSHFSQYDEKCYFVL